MLCTLRPFVQGPDREGSWLLRIAGLRRHGRRRARGAGVRAGGGGSLTSDVPEGTEAGPFPLAFLTPEAGGVSGGRAYASACSRARVSASSWFSRNHW
jgi:hypothetical protein